MKFDKWIDVVTDPLGLTGFALFLVFSYLAARRKNAEDRTLRVIFGGLAIAVALGGLGLAYQKQAAERGQAIGSEQSPHTTKQDTRGSIGSPAVSGVKGDVNIKIEAQGAGEGKEGPTGK